MPVMDEIREQQKKIKNRSLKQKFAYFWDYYRIHTIVIILAVIFVSFFVRDIISGSREEVLNVSVINSPVMLDGQSIMSDFATYAQIDTKKTQAVMDGSMSYVLDDASNTSTATSVKLMANYQLGDLDLVIADSDVFAFFASQGMFASLDTVLTSEQLDSLKDRLTSYSVTYDDTNTTSDVLCGLDVSDCTLFSTDGTPNSQKMVLGFVVNQKNKDNSLKFLDYILPGAAN